MESIRLLGSHCRMSWLRSWLGKFWSTMLHLDYLLLMFYKPPWLEPWVHKNQDLNLRLHQHACTKLTSKWKYTTKCWWSLLEWVERCKKMKRNRRKWNGWGGFMCSAERSMERRERVLEWVWCVENESTW